MLKPINIIKTLEREREKFPQPEERILEQVKFIFQENLFQKKNVLSHLKTYNQSFEFLNEDTLDKNRIFHLSEIKNLCIKYHLKFLDVHYYRGKLPEEALEEINVLSLLNKKPVKNIKILAETDQFRSPKKYHDPILFAETQKGNFYLIHQWGNTVPGHRALTSFPLRSLENLIGTIAGLCILLTLTIPQPWIMDTTKIPYWDLHRFALFFHLFILLGAMTIFWMISFRKNFSSSSWDEA